jgi:hypothetical protein
MKNRLQNQLSFSLLVLICAITPFGLMAQGVTTSSLSGSVTDEAGEPLIGANIVAIHVPSGTSYGTSTDIDGAFNIANMRVGGP